MFRDMGTKGTPAQYDQADRDYRRWASRLLKRGDLVGFVAETQGLPAASGCVWLQERQPRPGFPGGPLPYLLSMYTEPAFRGRGLAKRIVVAATKWCRGRGFRKFTLHASPAGRPIYEKLGWTRTWEMELRLPR